MKIGYFQLLLVLAHQINLPYFGKTRKTEARKTEPAVIGKVAKIQLFSVLRVGPLGKLADFGLFSKPL